MTLLLCSTSSSAGPPPGFKLLRFAGMKPFPAHHLTPCRFAVITFRGSVPMCASDLLKLPSDTLAPIQPQVTGSSTHSSEGYISDLDAPEAEEITDAHTIRLEPNPFAYGGFAGVHRGVWKPSWSKKDMLVAVKVLRLSGMSKEGNLDFPAQLAKIDRRLAREMFTWQKARHPNITPLLGFMRGMNGVRMPGDCPLLVSPYYKNGNMNSYLDKHPNADVLAILRQAARGLNYLHTFEPFPIAHLDIKGQNILINDAEQASICDFGVARMMDELSTGFTTSNPALTLAFAPPEVLNGSKGDTTADTFAFGGLILQGLSGKAPFHKRRKAPAQITVAVMNGTHPEQRDHPIPRLSPKAVEKVWALMERCWSTERADRPTMKDVLDELEVIASLNV